MDATLEYHRLPGHHSRLPAWTPRRPGPLSRRSRLPLFQLASGPVSLPLDQKGFERIMKPLMYKLLRDNHFDIPSFYGAGSLLRNWSYAVVNSYGQYIQNGQKPSSGREADEE